MSFSWTKRGLLLKPGGGIPGLTHASHPVVVSQGGNDFILVFSMRDANKVSSLYSVSFSVRDGALELTGTPNLALAPGKKGTFDSEGLLGCCAVTVRGRTFLYYTGWNNLGDGAWLCDTGLAELKPLSGEVHRRFEGPVMSRGIENPLFAAGTAIKHDRDRFDAWYNRGIGWVENPRGESVCRYGIFHAESDDGVVWSYSGKQVIPFLDDLEHSFGRPCVLEVDGRYHMWFGARGASGDPQYKIGYAYSEDKTSWVRRDDLAGVRPTGVEGDFDSDASTYPYVFEHEDRLIMLYNGNFYGATGIGYAVAQK